MHLVRWLCSKITWCSSISSWFNSQYPHGDPHMLLCPVTGDPISSSGSMVNAHGAPTYVLENTHELKIILKY